MDRIKIKTLVASAAVGILLSGGFAHAANNDLQSDAPAGTANITFDFLDSFGRGVTRNVLVATLDPGEKHGNTPNIYHHPAYKGLSRIDFPAIRLPQTPEEGRIVFAFRAWSDRPNQILPMVNNRTLDKIDFNAHKTVRDPSAGWHNYVLDMSDYAGQDIDFTLGLEEHIQYRWALPRIYVLEGNTLADTPLHVATSGKIEGWSIEGTVAEPVIENSSEGIRIRTSGGEIVMRSEPVLLEGNTPLALLRFNAIQVPEGASLSFSIVEGEHAASGSQAAETVIFSHRGTGWQEAFFSDNLDPAHGKVSFVIRLQSAQGQPLEVLLGQPQLFVIAPSVRLERLTSSQAFPTVGEAFTVTALIDNAGGSSLAADADAAVELVLPQGVSLAAGESLRKPIGALAEGEQTEISWELTGSREQVATLQAKVSGDDVPASDMEMAFAVYRENTPAVAEARAGDAFMGNEKIRVLFPKSDIGFGRGYIWQKQNGQWRQMAAIPYLSYLVIEDESGARHHYRMQARDASLRPAGSGVQTLQFDAVADGLKAKAVIRLSLAPQSEDLKLDYQLDLPQGTKLLAWRGPVLLAGEGSFGTQKDSALFPGLEWLVDAERSSGTEAFLPPSNLRVSPNSFKVTVPVMALSEGGSLLSLSWNPLQKWDGTHLNPTPFFSVPNWLDNQHNSAMGLFLPSVPSYVEENQLIAYRPYVVKAGEPLRIQATVSLGETDNGVASVVPAYLEKNGLPTELEWDRQRLFDRTRKAYFESHWHNEKDGWARWRGRKLSGFFPLILQALWMDYVYYAEPDSEVSKALKEKIDLGLRHHVEQGGKQIGVWSWQVGNVPGYLAAERTAVQRLIKLQQPDGNWGFDRSIRGDYGDPALMRGGSRGVGLTAIPAERVLRYARITGDAEALQAGLKALEAMRDYRVPRAAQGWEVPVHAPDILASAVVCNAYLEGYELTGDHTLLEQAVYWASTALPFIYTWEMPNVRVMKFGSIPVYGATHYVQSWLGTLVQWNGLEVALAFNRLAEYDSNPVWKTYAKGLLASSTGQQNSAGSLLDIWLVETARGGAVDIEPSIIMQTLWAVDGYLFQPQTSVLSDVKGTVRLSSAAHIRELARGGNAVCVVLESGKQRIPQPLIAFLVVGEQPQRVTVGGRVLERLNAATDPAEGWFYDAAQGFLQIRANAPAATPTEIVISFAN